MGDPIEELEGLHRALSPPEGVHPERKQCKPEEYRSLSPTLCGRSSVGKNRFRKENRFKFYVLSDYDRKKTVTGGKTVLGEYAL